VLDTYLTFAILGLGFGSIYASLGMGLVITYKGTGIINFSLAALAAWGALVTDELRTTGEFVLPVFIIPDRVTIDSGGLNLWTALPLGLLSTVVLALFSYLAIFRPMRTAPVLARIVASIGLLTTLQTLMLLRFGETPRNVEGILPKEWVTIAGLGIPRDRLYIAAIVVGAALLVGAWFRKSRTGLAIRATAENEEAASLARFSPTSLAGVTWVASAALTGLMLILASSIVPLGPTTYSLFVVPALAAALVGRLSSLTVTTAAGLALGMLQTEVGFLRGRSWWPNFADTSGVFDAVPFVIIVFALFIAGRGLPERGATVQARLPDVIRVTPRWPLVGLSFAAVTALAYLFSNTYRLALTSTLIGVLVALSIVVLTGLVGQITLAQAAFAGASAFLVMKLGDGWPFPLNMIAAVALATVLGTIVGIPALRIRGAQLAVVTMAGAVAIERFVFANPRFVDPSESQVHDPELFGLNLGRQVGRETARVHFTLLVLVLVTVSLLLVTNIIRSSTGRRFLAVRSNERAAASSGVDVAQTKLLAFAISSAIAGLAGTMMAFFLGQFATDSNQFAVFASLNFVVFAYLGGISSINGALIAGVMAPSGIAFVIINDYFDFFGGREYAALAGILLIVTMVINPIGIAGAAEERRLAKLAAKGEEDQLRHTPRMPEEGAPPELEPSPGSPALSVDGLTVRYGGLIAVNGASVEVGAGEIVGLIGPNGAGKTTFVDAATGFTPATGTVTLAGRRLDDRSAHRRARAGLGRTWQSGEFFADMSAYENVLVPTTAGTVRQVAKDIVSPTRDTAVSTAVWAMDLLGLRGDATSRPQDLSLGKRKLLGVARCLAGNPRVVCLDEPAAGLDSGESRELGTRLRDVAGTGIGVFLIDHDMGLVLDVCDRIYVLNFGEIIAAGTPEEIQSDPAVIDAYLGEETADAAPGGS